MPWKDLEKRREHLKKRYREDLDFKKRSNIAALKRKKIQKLKAVKYLGDKCKNCGYDEHPEIMVFHHTKGNKEFNVSHRLKLSWSKLIKELDKCVLLCPNCHSLAHINPDQW